MHLHMLKSTHTHKGLSLNAPFTASLKKAKPRNTVSVFVPAHLCSRPIGIFEHTSLCVSAKAVRYEHSSILSGLSCGAARGAYLETIISDWWSMSGRSVCCRGYCTAFCFELDNEQSRGGRSRHLIPVRVVVSRDEARSPTAIAQGTRQRNVWRGTVGDSFDV